MNNIFSKNPEIKITELKNNFYRHIGPLKEKLYQAVVKKGYFAKSPYSIKKKYLIIGVLFFSLISILANIKFPAFQSNLFLLSNIITSLIIILFGIIMPKKTIKGVDAKEHILGLKEYLSVAEKDRLKFHNAPSKKPEVFEKMLPYAMVLGVEKEWAQQFEKIYLAAPSWYEGSGGTAFNTAYLTNNLVNLQNSANKVLYSKPGGGGVSSGGSGFSGGGFSGGGFGGGGGGSW